MIVLFLHNLWFLKAKLFIFIPLPRWYVGQVLIMTIRWDSYNDAIKRCSENTMLGQISGPGAGWTCRIDDNLDSILLPVSEDKQTLF